MSCLSERHHMDPFAVQHKSNNEMHTRGQGGGGGAGGGEGVEASDVHKRRSDWGPTDMYLSLALFGQ